MQKVVKDVFINCIDNSNKFSLANVDEVKFSKKLNACILLTSSNEKILKSDIEYFERKAKERYALSSFKVEHK